MSKAHSEAHSHDFLGQTHSQSERNVWAVIGLTLVMMIVEIAGGAMFGSIALVADGFHMSTHAGALLLAALAYTLARKYSADPRFTFGASKFGDLAGYTSAVILTAIAAGIGYESVTRLFAPQPISFAEAIPIAALGLVVNVASAWLLSRGGHHHHGYDHDHQHDHAHDHAHDERRALGLGGREVELSIFEEGVPPRFRLIVKGGGTLEATAVEVETRRPNGVTQIFRFRDLGDFLESGDEIPEPHGFDVCVRIGAESASCQFAEHAHGHDDAMSRDNNMRAAVMHVIADAAVSVLVIAGLTLAKLFGWLWMDPVAGLVGAAVILSWSYTLIRDTGRVLLDMNPDKRLGAALRSAVEHDGDHLLDLHMWRLGPGHLGAILSVETASRRESADYHALARGVSAFSHLTIEVVRRPLSDVSEPERRVA